MILSIYQKFDVSENLDDRSILNDIAIVSTSCDKRHELWAAQFPMLFKHWPKLKSDLHFVPIYLISNFKTYNDPRVKTIAVGEDISWSDNLIKALEQIDKKYIVLLMDDYILTAPVDEERLIQLLNLMKNNHSPHTEVVQEQIQLYDGIFHKTVPWLIYRSQRGGYRVSLQAGLWDKDDLKNLLRPRESAWDFEIKANKRSFQIFRPFYLIVSQPVFSYLNAVEASGTYNPNSSTYESGALQFLSKEGIEMHTKEMPVR